MNSKFHKAWFDGSSNPITKRSGIGGYILTPDDEIIEDYSIEINYESDSTVVEFIALIELLKRIQKHNILITDIYSDCLTLCDSINEKNKVRKKNKKVYELREKAKYLLSNLTYYELTWTSRENNSLADRLSKSYLSKEEYYQSTRGRINVDEMAITLYSQYCPKSAKKCRTFDELKLKIERCIELGNYLGDRKDGSKTYHYYNNLFYVKDGYLVDMNYINKLFFVSEAEKVYYKQKAIQNAVERNQMAN